MSVILEARNLTKYFRMRGTGLERKYMTALDGFYMRIVEEKPIILGIAGESGSGKTTLARMLLDFYRPSEGDICFRNKSLDKLTKQEMKLFRMDVQAIFQDPFEVFNPYYKIDHILETPLRKFGVAKKRKEIQSSIADRLSTVGLRPDETLGRFPHQLSGGQRQRIMIARALLLNPKVIIADEPVSMVDASHRAIILDNLLRLNKEMGISLIYITHDLTTAYQLCDTIAVLYKGQVMELGDIQSVIKNPKHPYTQLLIRSIPMPDPEVTWGQAEDRLTSKEEKEQEYCCRFSDRCPEVMDICRNRAPDIYQLANCHACRCFLYDRNVSTNDMAGILQCET